MAIPVIQRFVAHLFDEQGLKFDEGTAWMGLGVSANTPKIETECIQNALAKILTNPEFKTPLEVGAAPA